MLKGISEYQDKRIEKNSSTRELIDNGFVGSGETSGFFSIDFFLGFVSRCKSKVLDVTMVTSGGGTN